MSRTDELRDSGARELGGGGNNPFVKWSDQRAYVEGVVEELWESQYGMNATVTVEKTEGHVEAQMGKGEPKTKIDPGMKVNVGLNYSALTGITADQVGHRVHVAFEGWEEAKSGNNYRAFKVFDLGPADGGEGTSGEDSGEEPDPSARQESMQGAGPGAPDADGPPPPDELPF